MQLPVTWRAGVTAWCLAAGLGACSATANSTDAGATDTSSNAHADASTDAPSDAAADVPTDFPYPAFTPVNPQVQDFGGTVLIAPYLHPVFVNNGSTPYPNQSMILDFLTRYMASATWITQVGEYGPGAGSVGPAVQIDASTLPASGSTGRQLGMWLGMQVQSGAWGATRGNDIYVFFIDQGRVIEVSTDVYLCGEVGGYHTDVQDAFGHDTSVAVVPNCDSTLDSITQTASHELVESATDPYPNSTPAFATTSIDTPPDGAWLLAYSGGEVADLCEERTDDPTTPTDVGYSILRTWSNMAAMLGTADPCVPVPAGSVYFNTYPVFPDVVQVNYGMGSVSAHGVLLPASGSATVPVQFFSTGPTSGPWSVTTIEVTMGNPDLRFVWDHNTGSNGDVRNLTITATADITGGRVFVITSTLGQVSTTWAGAVGPM